MENHSAPIRAHLHVDFNGIAPLDGRFNGTEGIFRADLAMEATVRERDSNKPGWSGHRLNYRIGCPAS